MLGATLVLAALYLGLFEGAQANDADDADGNLTTTTTTVTPPTIWVVTGPCPLVGRRHHCVTSPHWPEPYDDDAAECELRIDSELADDLYIMRPTHFQLDLYELQGFYDLEDSFTVDTDMPFPQSMRAAELDGRLITANDTIIWSSQGWTNSSEGWVLCADARWFGTGRAAGPSDSPWYSEPWSKPLLVFIFVVMIAACKANKEEKEEEAAARERVRAASAPADVEAGVAATGIDETQVVRIPAEQVRRV